MAKKSRFWGNFWGETGRNTGKWASNKVFGPSGWATPRRHIFDSDSTGKSRSSSNRTSSSGNSSDDWDEARIDRLMGTANDISFSGSSVDSICNSLDDLLTSARKANKYAGENKLSGSIFQTKINAGIMRLRRLGERELADFYQSEFKKVKYSTFLTKGGPYFYMLGLMLFLLILFKCSGETEYQSNPVQDWLNGN